MFTGTIIDAPEIPVRYVAGDRTTPVPEQAPAAFEQLEANLDSLRGLKFYGVVMDGEYRACVAVPPGQVDANLPGSEFTIPGGRYFCRRLDDFLSDAGKISRLVDQTIVRSDFDSSRPVIEFYRGHDQLSIRVPVS